VGTERELVFGRTAYKMSLRKWIYFNFIKKLETVRLISMYFQSMKVIE
jgi:hypothetical protein